MTLRQSLISSTFWLSVGNALNQIFSIVVFAILSRLMEPMEFGIVAFAVIFIDVTGVVAWAGVGDAIVRRDPMDDVFSSTALWVNIFLATVLFAFLSVVLAPGVERLGYEDIQPVITVLALMLIINSCDTVFSATLRRDFSYRTIAIRGMLSNFVSGLLSICLASAGAGVWALVAQRVFAVAIQFTVTLTAVKWRPKLVFNKHYAREILTFAISVMGAQFLNQLNGHVTGMILGVFAGPTALAIYRTGSRFLSSLTQLIIVPIQQPVLSAFASLPREKWPEAFLRIVQTTALIAFPAYLGASVISPEITAILFGPKWAASATVMALLAPMIGATVFDFILAPTLIGIGRGKLLLFISGVSVLVSATMALATVKYGPDIVALGQTLGAYIRILIVIPIARQVTGIGFWSLLKSIFVPLTASFMMAACLYGVRALWISELTPAYRLVILGGLGIVIYGLFILMFGRKMLGNLTSGIGPLLPGRLHRILVSLSGTRKV
ncbi:oligosaccharide flippase family protein [Bradyrhizobium yuanmingense]|uniref:oligosaccharide flippase family protein n=1 Tax=Bradyrhizobium yuanmingense TaxID=108015 RepID=UPI0023BA13D1|nr:oligosaccharide flippase family protein [Bradyrhizobium yuanmingense]MDF0516824.1 oligosaccharide flippase family protein [Bradyrhizobium yuanmingense]